MVVLAANPKSFAAAIEIAMDTECSMQGAYDTGFINANDNRKKGAKKFYKNSQNTSYNYSQPPNSNDSRKKFHPQQAWGPNPTGKLFELIGCVNFVPGQLKSK